MSTPCSHAARQRVSLSIPESTEEESVGIEVGIEVEVEIGQQGNIGAGTDIGILTNVVDSLCERSLYSAHQYK